MKLPLMEESMRWFGPNDTVKLEEIRQSGASAVFTSLHEIPYGDEWPLDTIIKRRDLIAAAGLKWNAVESVPVSEAIKTRTGDFALHIENYKKSIRHLGQAGIEVVIYNFMPVLDWVRTDLKFKLPDGAEALRYDPVMFAAFDIYAMKRPDAQKSFDSSTASEAKKFWEKLGSAGQDAFTMQILSLFPGVKWDISTDGLRAMLENYKGIDTQKLKEHLRLFLKEVVPVAEASGVRLAVHPDDPPFSVLGLPRIVSSEQDIVDLFKMVDSPANGLCFCTGSLGALRSNDPVGIVRRHGPRIHAVHLRNVAFADNGVFFEADHLAGSTDMYAVVKALVEEQTRRGKEGRRDTALPMRPDHGHKILDDFRRAEPTCPGYPLLGRMRGLAELRGLQLGVARSLSERS
jgi:mannonate dehydratase